MSVLFVCLGNICRSPAAQAVFARKVKEDGLSFVCRIESCALGDWNNGLSPDSRMIESAKKRGYLLDSIAKGFQPQFFKEFDYILAVDQKVANELKSRTTDPAYSSKIKLITAFSDKYLGRDIPDPFYSDPAAFDLVLDIIEESLDGLIAALKVLV